MFVAGRFDPVMHNVPKGSDSTAANAARFLNCVRPF